jgi:glycosyltransferase involved in cell wall biosynthesis
LKIAQVNVFFQPFMVGGAEWYVYNISRELTRMGHDVHVFTADRYNGKTADQSETIDGISVHRLHLKIDWSYRMKIWDGLAEALHGGAFDVIHTYDYAQPHSAVALGAAKKAGCRSALTVFDIHSMIPRVWYKQYPMKLMEDYLARRTLPRTDRILVRAPNLIQPLIELGGERDRILVTPSGIRDDSLGDFDGESFLRKYKIDGSPVILYLGRLNPLKGPQYLLDAAPKILSSFPDSQFVFVGPDQSGYGEILRTQASKHGVESHTHFVGPIYDFNEKMQAYASCDVFALPTAYEGTSQAIFEAMAQGKPVVASNVGGIPSQISDGAEGFLVDYGSSEQLTTRIVQILGDKSSATKMGQKGRQRVMDHRYSILASRLAAIYLGEVSGN